MTNLGTKRVRADRRRGNVIVEAALTLFLVLFTLLGLLELGVTLFIYQAMTESCRRAVRYAVVNPYNEDAIKNVLVYGNPEGSGQPFAGLSTQMVTVELEPLDSVNSLIRVEVEKQSHNFFTPLFSRAPFSLKVVAVRVTESLGATS